MSSPTTGQNAPADVAAASPQNDTVDTLEVDDGTDSSYGDSIYSDTTSLTSSIVRGIVENGRRYQTLREGKYWGPSDEQAFESMNLSHAVYLTLDSKEENPLFRSPIGDNPQNILDLGTGDANWAFHVADSYPSAHVTGVDLFPAPAKFMPPNCELIADDIAKPWLFSRRFDLIHSRFLVGSFTPAGWKGLYKQAYANLVPGGWFEAVEPSLCMYSDDGSLPLDSKCAKWGPMFHEIGAKVTGQPMDVCYTMKESIAAAGFINLHEKTYKIPVGGWAKNPVLKQAGKLYLEEAEAGLEGYALLMLTKAGLPKPWSVEEVQTHLAGIKEEWSNPKWHFYTLARRIWCQKPFDEVKAEAKA